MADSSEIRSIPQFVVVFGSTHFGHTHFILPTIVAWGAGANKK